MASPTPPVPGDTAARRRRRVLAAAASAGLLLSVALAATPAAAATAPAYVVVGPTQKVMASQGSVSGSSGAQLMGARNEFVSFQIVLPGGSGGQSGVSVTTGNALTGPGGTIPNSAVTIYREAYYTTSQPSAGGRAVGAWPDILIPTVDALYHEQRNAFPVNVPAGNSRVAWIDILIPANQAAGGYDGTITVTNSGGGQASVPVHLDVRDFTLPSTSSLKTLFQLDWRTACDALYGSSCNPWNSYADEQRAWQANYDVARLALDDRFTIANMQFQPPVNSTEVGFFNQYMLPLINGTAPTRLSGARLTTVSVDTGYLSQWKSLAQSDGFSGVALTYDHGCDEMGNDSSKWSACRSRVSGYKSTWPGLPNVITGNIGEVDTYDPSYSITDDLVPVVDQMDGLSGTAFAGDQHHKYDSFLTNSGKQVWLYTSCDVSGCGGAGETDAYYQHPWMDYTVDTAAGQNRAMGWLDYTYNATGELYWDTTYTMTTAWTNQFAFGGHGDGNLLYPGTTDRIGGSTPIPLESLRMKLMRDGYQDYEYLRLAGQHGHATDAYNLAKQVYPSTHDAGATDAAIDPARKQLADWITGTTTPPPATSQLRYTANALTGPVTVDGQLGEYADLPAIVLNGANNNTTQVRLAWDNTNLYAAYTVTDNTINVNETGRDGELWDGDSVELMIDRYDTNPTAPTNTVYHLLVNTDGALTDETGTGSGWDRTWTANAQTAVTRTTTGYTVEIALPWNSMGPTPTTGDQIGLDIANNDSDTSGQAIPYDWSHLTRFAQPNLWGTMTVGP